MLREALLSLAVLIAIIVVAVFLNLLGHEVTIFVMGLLMGAALGDLLKINRAPKVTQLIESSESPPQAESQAEDGNQLVRPVKRPTFNGTRIIGR